MQQTSFAFAYHQGVPQDARQGLAAVPLRQEGPILCLLLQPGRGLATHQLQAASLFPRCAKTPKLEMLLPGTAGGDTWCWWSAALTPSWWQH
jgi:hypothetical protein